MRACVCECSLILNSSAQSHWCPTEMKVGANNAIKRRKNAINLGCGNNKITSNWKRAGTMEAICQPKFYCPHPLCDFHKSRILQPRRKKIQARLFMCCGNERFLRAQHLVFLFSTRTTVGMCVCTSPKKVKHKIHIIQGRTAQKFKNNNLHSRWHLHKKKLYGVWKIAVTDDVCGLLSEFKALIAYEIRIFNKSCALMNYPRGNRFCLPLYLDYFERINFPALHKAVPHGVSPPLSMTPIINIIILKIYGAFVFVHSKREG